MASFITNHFLERTQFLASKLVQLTKYSLLILSAHKGRCLNVLETWKDTHNIQIKLQLMKATWIRHIWYYWPNFEKQDNRIALHLATHCWVTL